MGIRGLSKAIRALAPAAVRETTLADYAGNVLAIDSCIFMYKFRYLGDPVRLFTQQVEMLRQHRITPIYYFDGAACAAKQAEVARRREAKAQAHEAVDAARARAQLTQSRSLSTLGPDPLAAILATEDEVRKAERRVEAQPSSADYSGVRRRLAELGVEVRQAQGDGEKACAAAVRSGEAYAAVTEDFDVLPYGSTRMLTHLGQPTLIEYHLPTILNDARLTMPQFIDFCILLGCDLCPSRIKGVGEKRAYAMLQEHGSIEGILENLPPQYSASDDFDFRRARSEFEGGAA